MPKQRIILRGIPANSGKAEGKVMVISGDIINDSKLLNELSRVKIGEILVTEMTRPAFVMALRKVSGIITDRGGILSHAAMVAREFNLPCVVNTEKATKILKTGQKILLDADKGIIYGS